MEYSYLLCKKTKGKWIAYACVMGATCNRSAETIFQHFGHDTQQHEIHFNTIRCQKNFAGNHHTYKEYEVTEEQARRYFNESLAKDYLTMYGSIDKMRNSVTASEYIQYLPTTN